MIFIRRFSGSVPLLLLFAVPLVASLVFALVDAVNPSAWRALFQHPQLWGGLTLSLATAVAATAISLFIALTIAAFAFESGQGQRLNEQIAATLAIPHLAFAIGLGFLIMPSGFLARLLAPLFGWASPPTWITVHDPYGFALIVALACKETGFLLFNLLAILSRTDIAQLFRSQQQAAQALGHGTLSVWHRLFIPQLWPSLIWPLAIVFIYAATVVDVALVLGPTQPPTLSLVVWSDINGANVADNARAGVGAIFLALASAACLAGFEIARGIMRPISRQWITRGPAQRSFPFWLGRAKWNGLCIIFFAVVSCLLVLSLVPLWPFPDLLPPQWDGAAWQTALAQANPFWLSLGLALATSLSALAALVAWFETVNEKWDKPLLIAALAALALPALLLALGQYRLLLHLNLTGTLTGLYLVHFMPVAAYVFVLLKGPYRGFDPRYAGVSAGLTPSYLDFLTFIKWPLLKAPLLASLAIGFTVSFGQYVPAQFATAGRMSTLPMEAVTLSAGADRPLTAAFALLLMMPPLIAFLLSGIFGKPRWKQSHA